eukprot:Protomagalhaensia_wolfi_Nauph_80__1548@NODE_194_length_3224_cov_73_602512_g147_i0_p1_GENE_NODE_194_length_3224_cov_73_602512_g147_i0NODE_194_length_3224_cov_73_602512_g147_i0_p1_ORF_typecomplete_len367_score64_16Methyltransf_10/PF05971_12/4_9e54Methyltransf_10/PF05971_12/5_3e08MTS/PF05175_14/9_9e14Methyltransf_31/PF13847_6/1e07PrmA/PF06325_13/4_2e06UPF0020/PF01170_18/1_3e05Methyltransf_23/PF13489_6/0_0001Methyltransf_25/PF13649_6/0_00077NAS/PF03059_16/0_00079CMAS/PF02353_20/0_00088Methyltransf_3
MKRRRRRDGGSDGKQEQQQYVANNDKAHPENKLMSIDFEALEADYPYLSCCFKTLPKGRYLDFKNPATLKCLTKASFHKYYNIDWDLPEGYLISPLPGRLNYLLEAKDLLKLKEKEWMRNVKILDVGVGANCIHPLLLVKEFGCHVVGSDIDADALKIAQGLVDSNGLSDSIELRHQENQDSFFLGVLDGVDLTVCNPPFYHEENVQANPKRRRQATSSELVSKEGHLGFIIGMIEESLNIHLALNGDSEAKQKLVDSVKDSTILGDIGVSRIGPSLPPGRLRLPANEPIYYTSLVPAMNSLKVLEAALRTVYKAPTWTTVTLYQGKQTRWMVAWSWLKGGEIDDRLKSLLTCTGSGVGTKIHVNK